MTAGVYAVRDGSGLVKIGRSADIPKRLHALRTLSASPLQIVRIVETDYQLDAERELHQRFKHRRRHGEWFALSDADLGWLAAWEPPLTARDRSAWDNPVKVALKPSLKAQLERIAAAERRTTNNWIIITLEDAVKQYLDEHPELGQAAGRERPS